MARPKNVKQLPPPPPPPNSNSQGAHTFDGIPASSQDFAPDASEIGSQAGYDPQLSDGPRSNDECTVWIGKMPLSVRSKHDVANAFTWCGNITHIHLRTDLSHGFVHFEHPDAASQAIDIGQLHIHGVPVDIRPAKQSLPKPTQPNNTPASEDKPELWEDMEGVIRWTGIIELFRKGHGFLRPCPDANLAEAPEGLERGVYVSPSQVERFNLRGGSLISALVRPPRRAEERRSNKRNDEGSWALVRILEVNSASAKQVDTGARMPQEEPAPAFEWTGRLELWRTARHGFLRPLSPEEMGDISEDPPENIGREGVFVTVTHIERHQLCDGDVVRGRVIRPKEAHGPSCQLLEVLEVRKAEVIEEENLLTFSGTFESFRRGFGFLRPIMEAGLDDRLLSGAYVPMALVERHGLRDGETVTVTAKPAKDEHSDPGTPRSATVVSILSTRENDGADTGNIWELLDSDEPSELPAEWAALRGVRIHGVVVRVVANPHLKFGFLEAEHDSIDQEVYFHPTFISEPDHKKVQHYTPVVGEKAFFEVQARKVKGSWGLLAVDVNFHEYKERQKEHKARNAASKHADSWIPPPPSRRFIGTLKPGGESNGFFYSDELMRDYGRDVFVFLRALPLGWKYQQEYSFDVFLNTSGSPMAKDVQAHAAEHAHRRSSSWKHAPHNDSHSSSSSQFPPRFHAELPPPPVSNQPPPPPPPPASNQPPPPPPPASNRMTLQTPRVIPARVQLPPPPLPPASNHLPPSSTQHRQNSHAQYYSQFAPTSETSTHELGEVEGEDEDEHEDQGNRARPSRAARLATPEGDDASDYGDGDVLEESEEEQEGGGEEDREGAEDENLANGEGEFEEVELDLAAGGGNLDEGKREGEEGLAESRTDFEEGEKEGYGNEEGEEAEEEEKEAEVHGDLEGEDWQSPIGSDKMGNDHDDERDSLVDNDTMGKDYDEDPDVDQGRGAYCEMEILEDEAEAGEEEEGDDIYEREEGEDDQEDNIPGSLGSDQEETREENQDDDDDNDSLAAQSARKSKDARTRSSSRSPLARRKMKAQAERLNSRLKSKKRGAGDKFKVVPPKPKKHPSPKSSRKTGDNLAPTPKKRPAPKSVANKEGKEARHDPTPIQSGQCLKLHTHFEGRRICHIYNTKSGNECQNRCNKLHLCQICLKKHRRIDHDKCENIGTFAEEHRKRGRGEESMAVSKKQRGKLQVSEALHADLTTSPWRSETTKSAPWRK